ncbi:hypothetical protein MKX01_005510 [Papaver californicum]|nr:hypothetical protein MKX01_005510 [Papaver californicum]
MKEIVCVTGAGEFLASWVVKYLRAEGFIVHAIVLNPSDEKYDHLNNFENFLENLHLFKADLLDYHGLFAAIAGCRGVFVGENELLLLLVFDPTVFNVASPVPSAHVANPKIALGRADRARFDTNNVLKACSEAKVKRVVIVSSNAAVILNPYWPKGKPMNELCWSEKEYCKTSELSLGICKEEMVRCGDSFQALIIGPMLQSTVNASSSILLKILKDGAGTMVNKDQRIVDVRDMARAVLLAYEKLEAEGRYICSAYLDKTLDLIDVYPKYNYPQKMPFFVFLSSIYIIDGITEADDQPKLNSEKMQKLGWKHRTLEDSQAMLNAIKSRAS